MPTPHFERDSLTEREKEKEKRGDDVFKPPYNPNLYVGELKDEDEGTEYVVLVSEFWVFCLFGETVRECETDACCCCLSLALVHAFFCSSTSTLSLRSISSLSPKVRSGLLYARHADSVDVRCFL